MDGRFRVGRAEGIFLGKPDLDEAESYSASAPGKPFTFSTGSLPEVT